MSQEVTAAPDDKEPPLREDNLGIAGRTAYFFFSSAPHSPRSSIHS